MDRIKDFFVNELLGKLALRLGASLAAYLASGVIGVHVSIDPAELSAIMVTGVNLLISKLKHEPAK